MFECWENMGMSFGSVLDSLSSATAELADARMPELDDAALLSAQSRLAESRRRIDAAIALTSAEISRRSDRELGYDGLAQRLGAGSAEKLVQQVSGVSRREAGALIRVGSLDAASPLTYPVAAGRISVEAAEVIRAGLGEPTPAISAQSIAAATESLVSFARSLTLEQLAARVRSTKDELDAAGIPAREDELRQRRYLRLSPTGDGMVRLSGLLDPESATLVGDAFDAVTSPRRGGPRFVDPATRAQAAALENDPRTLDQLMADTLVDIVRVAAGADPGQLFGQRRPAVRVLVAERDLRRGAGPAQLEATGSTAGGGTVSLATAARYACEVGIQPVVVGDKGDVLRLGRAQRLFSPQQRIALAARDGGCRFPGCDRPPSYTEAHHITPWSRGGRTDVADGILLCRHHHLLVHNNAWQITRRGTEYFVTPPPGVGVGVNDGQEIPMRPPGVIWQRAQRAG